MSEELEQLALQKLNGEQGSAALSGDENEQVALNALNGNTEPQVEIHAHKAPDEPQVDLEEEPVANEPANETVVENVNASENPEKDFNFDIDLDEGVEVPATNFAICILIGGDCTARHHNTRTTFGR